MNAIKATPRPVAVAGGNGGAPLTMTPELREAIALLRRSRLELEAEIAEESDANPVVVVEE